MDHAWTRSMVSKFRVVGAFRSIELNHWIIGKIPKCSAAVNHTGHRTISSAGKAKLHTKEGEQGSRITE